MKVCTSFIDRLKGLTFKKEITEDYLFPNCRSVHTFLMKINIDIIALNKEGKIIKIYRNVSPNKIIFAPIDTYAILETKANSKYKAGTIINIKQK